MYTLFLGVNVAETLFNCDILLLRVVMTLLNRRLPMLSKSIPLLVFELGPACLEVLSKADRAFSLICYKP